MPSEEIDKVNALQMYNDGKFKRLNLLFVVNGGAFAILKLSLESGSIPLPGKLTLFHVSLGAVVFTIVMVVDTWRWSAMIRDKFLGELALTLYGKIILVLLGLLIITAWVLVGFF